MHRNSNNNNKIIEVISREILYSGKCMKSEITSAAVVSVLRPVGNHQIPCELSSFALFVVSDWPLHWSQPWQCGMCSVLLCPPWKSTLHTHRMASLLHVLISTEVLCSAVCKGGIYLICLKLTNPPVRRNKTNLRRGKVPSSEMIRCYNAVSFEPNSVGQAAIDVVPIVT